VDIKKVINSQTEKGVQETVVLTKDSRKLWGLRQGDRNQFPDWTFFPIETQNGGEKK